MKEALGVLIKRIIIFLIVILLFLSFSSCQQGSTRTVADDYLDAIKVMDFELAYSYIWPYDNNSLSKEAFVKKYDSIFSALTIVDIKVSDIFVTNDSFGTFYKYKCSYVTEKYGTYSYDFKIDIKSANDIDYIDWNQSLIFPSMKFEDKLYIETIKTARGEIFTEKGELVAKNDYGTAVYMDVTKVKNILSLSKSLATILDVEQVDIIEAFNNGLLQNSKTLRNNVVILNTFPKNYFDEDAQNALLSFEGIGIDHEMYAPIRTYPFKVYLSHILGYVAPISESFLNAHPDKGYTIDSMVGKTGVEASYEDYLKGKDGLIIYISDKWGNKKEVLYEIPSQEGKDIYLTINIKKQKEAYDALESHLKSNQSGVAIVMDASTGQVQAMCSYPSYDNNIFSFPISVEEYDKLTNINSRKPLYDRATKGMYPPGSLIKPFTIVPALQLGLINKNSEFSGSIVDNRWTPNIKNWNAPPIKRVGSTPSPMSLYNAMAFSDNIYFAWTALKVGVDPMVDYLKKIGFEQDFDFDIPVKRSNIINNDQHWYSRLLADVGYGQAQLLVTPLQIASMYTAYANKTGNIMQPILVSQVKQTQGNDHVLLESKTPKVYATAVDQKTYNTIYPALKKVMTEGTGRRVSVPGTIVAGKTGTAEVGSSKSNEISWISAYWMDGAYNKLVLVMIETKTGDGGAKIDIANTLLSP